jgi:sec-independent protein translocase protein TatC
MKAEEGQATSFWDHLEALRWTIFRSLIALVVFAVVGFALMPTLFDTVIMAPCRSDFFLYKYLCQLSSHINSMWIPDFCGDDFHVDVINIQLASQFFTHMSTSFYFALLCTFPYLLYEIWKFVAPALYPHEKKNVVWVFLFGSLLFFVGCLVGYFVVFPMTLRFLASYQLSTLIANQISLDSYMNNFLMLIMIMGIVFELPVLSWFLSKIGILKKSFFKQYRRYAVVILLVAAAVITPSGDPFTLMVVFLPLYLLYEMSAVLVKK